MSYSSYSLTILTPKYLYLYMAGDEEAMPFPYEPPDQKDL